MEASLYDVVHMGSRNNHGANFVCYSNGDRHGGSPLSDPANIAVNQASEGFAFYNAYYTLPRLLMYITGENGNVGIRGNLVLGKGQKHVSSTYKLDVAGDANIDGFVRATNYIATSDRNLKSNIEKIDNETVLNKVNQLNGYTFHFKDDKEKKKRSGLIAQEVESVMPELVETNSEGHKAMDYNGMIAYLVECVKMQQQQMNIQEQQMKMQQQQMKLQQQQINVLQSKLENISQI